MKKNQGFIGIGLILAIILGIAVVGGGAYFLGKSSNSVPKTEENNLPQENQNTNIPATNNPTNNTTTTATSTTTKQEPVCDVKYNTTDESKVASEQSPALITGFEKKCDGNYYFTFDYLGKGEGDPESGNGSYYTNTNLKLRTFRIDSNLKVKLTDNTDVSLNTFVSSLKKFNTVIFNQSSAYGRNDPTGQPVFDITIKNGVVNIMKEVYLP